MPTGKSESFARKAGASSATQGRAAFTLIEIMVAVGLIGVFLAIGIPSLYQNMQQDSMRKAVSDVMEACSTARARAILDGTPMDLRIRPADRQFSVGPAATAAPDDSALPPSLGFEGDAPPPRGFSGGGSFTVTLGPSMIVEGLGVNGEDWTEDPEARVRFYPNGTCDEMSIVLLSAKGERRNIFLEVVTGFADLESDPLKFKAR